MDDSYDNVVFWFYRYLAGIAIRRRMDV